MKGFTLIEIALILLIIGVLTSISLRFTIFSGDTLYLKEFVYRFSSNINLLKDFSLGRRIVSLAGQSAKICGYGILMTSNDYLGYAYATSSPLDCDFIASTTPQAFAPQAPLWYLHTNGEVRQNPIEPLQIKDRFLKRTGTSDYFRISLTSPTCSDDLFSFYPQIALIYYNPYADLLLLGGGSWDNLLPSDWNNIYLCLSYKNETRFLKVNRAGQVLVISP